MILNLNIVEILYLIEALIETKIETLKLGVDKTIIYKNKLLLNQLHQTYLIKKYNVLNNCS